nr:ATP synthase CF1 delta subunit [Cyanidioschyzonaceae sp. 2]
MKQKIVEPYAQALFSLRDDLSSYIQQLWQIVCDPKIMQWLMNPSIPKSAKLSLFQHFDPIIQSWLEVIWNKKRIHLLPEICAYYIQLCNKKAGVVCVSITSAKALTSTQTLSLETQLKHIAQATSLQCNYTVDPQLIAGLRIQLNGKLLDTSWQTQLKQLQKYIW